MLLVSELFVVQAAHASTISKSDNFEVWRLAGSPLGQTVLVPPEDRWTLENYGDSYAGFINLGSPQNNVAVLWARTEFASVGKKIVILYSNRPINATCTASVKIKTTYTVSFNIEIIDPDTWYYIALKSQKVNTNFKFVKYELAPFTITKGALYFRVSVLGNGSGPSVIHVDDVVVNCTVP